MVAQLVIVKEGQRLSIITFISGSLLLNQGSVYGNGLSMKFKKENWKFNVRYLGAVRPAMKNTDVRVL